MKCEYYKLDDINGYGSPVCFGTKEREICSCHGDKNRCDFNYFPKKQNEFETLLEDYRKFNTQSIKAKVKLEEATEEYRKINNELTKIIQAIEEFKKKIDYDKFRKAVIDFTFDSVPSCLFDLIRDKIYDELDNDEIFNLALQMGIDCSDYLIKGD